MNRIVPLFAFVLAALALPAQAASNCEAQATEKKLAGAAKTSFVKKCEADAGSACESQATEITF